MLFFFLLFTGICHLAHVQKRAYSALHPQAWTYVYSSMPVGTYRVQSLGFPKIVYCLQHSELEVLTGLINAKCQRFWLLAFFSSFFAVG